MAENKNDFDEKKFAKAEKWFQEKIKHRECELCNTNTWLIPDTFVTPTPFNGLPLRPNWAAYPQIMTICKNCGHTRYFNAAILGLIEQKEEGV